MSKTLITFEIVVYLSGCIICFQVQGVGGQDYNHSDLSLRGRSLYCARLPAQQVVTSGSLDEEDLVRAMVPSQHIQHKFQSNSTRPEKKSSFFYTCVVLSSWYLAWLCITHELRMT